jgi:hypothetical protein
VKPYMRLIGNHDRVIVQVDDVGQCLVATCSVMARGSGKMPNEGELPEIQKQKWVG